MKITKEEKPKEEKAKKEKLFPIWCPTEDQKNYLKETLEDLRKRYHSSNYQLIMNALGSHVGRKDDKE